MEATSTTAGGGRILNHFGQRYVSPDFLQKPALQDWLADQQVAANFKAIATSRIVYGSEWPAEIVARLVESYSKYTGEAHYLANGPLEVVTAVPRCRIHYVDTLRRTRDCWHHPGRGFRTSTLVSIARRDFDTAPLIQLRKKHTQSVRAQS